MSGFSVVFACVISYIVYRFHGRAYRDGRTWRQRTERLQANWEPRIDEMLDAYLIWRYSSSSDHRRAGGSTTGTGSDKPKSTPGTPRDTLEEPDHSSYDFMIEVLDLYTLKVYAKIPRSGDSKSVAEALMMQGYIGNTPENPTLALSVKTLQLFCQIRLRKPSFSIEAFTRVLCDLYNVRELVLPTSSLYLSPTGPISPALSFGAFKRV